MKFVRHFLFAILLSTVFVNIPLPVCAEEAASATSATAQWPVAEFETGGTIKPREIEVKDTDGSKKTVTIDFLTNPGAGDSAELSSDFGPRVGGENISRMHPGIDIPVAVGTPVFAAVGGEVVGKGLDANGGGYSIKIKYKDNKGNVYFNSYCHLIDDTDKKNIEKYPPLVKIGMIVKTGQQIGWADTTGCDSAHLHFGVTQEGVGYVNPLTVLPYQNNEIPKVEIIPPPKDGDHVGKSVSEKEVEIQVKVTAKEKDVSKLVLLIDGKEAQGAFFDFGGSGRNKVNIDVGGKKYIGNKGWKEATTDKEKDPDSYVQVTVVGEGGNKHTDDTINTYVYTWNTWAFLDMNKVEFKKDVSIKAVAYQAQGELERVRG